MTVGLAAVAATGALGAYLHLRPGLNGVDHLGFALRPPASTHWWRIFRAVTRFGTWPALAIGSLGAAMVARFTGRRDRWRALACLLGPMAAAALDQFVIKPLVGRLYQGELSFASGSVTVIAAVSTAWVLAVPRRFRTAAAVLGSLGVATMIVAVIALRWHYPTDALAGVVLGVGVVLMVDGSIRILTGRQPSGKAVGALHASGHSTNGSGVFRTTRGTIRSRLIESEGGTMQTGADTSGRGMHRLQPWRLGRATGPPPGPTHQLGRPVVVVLTAIRPAGSVRFLGLAHNVRRALFSLTGRSSAQAFAEGFKLEPATEAAGPIGRG
jgi:membrane-associated phospholipid phosphatase